jgi:hypothetical protein
VWVEERGRRMRMIESAFRRAIRVGVAASFWPPTIKDEENT